MEGTITNNVGKVFDKAGSRLATGKAREYAHGVSDKFKFHLIHTEALEAVSTKATIDENSIEMFRHAERNVAFVGMYVISKTTAYLHPLTNYWIDGPTGEKFETKNENFNWETFKGKQLESIIHKAGSQETSHAQLGKILGNNDFFFSDMIGFAITKRADSIDFSGQSQTTNQWKFHYGDGPRDATGLTNGLDFYVTREWGLALMGLIDRVLGRYV